MQGQFKDTLGTFEKQKKLLAARAVQQEFIS
jgi:hypothetical protein